MERDFFAGGQISVCRAVSILAVGRGHDPAVNLKNMEMLVIPVIYDSEYSFASQNPTLSAES